jgi:SWI/SNF-related matrix-associated actin-dependent regulator 1 of chromatin subfamily A
MTDLSQILNWSKPERRQTSAGEKIFRRARVPLDSPFWPQWRADQTGFRLRGVSVRQVRDGETSSHWIAEWYCAISEKEELEQELNFQKSRAVDAAIQIPAPNGLEYAPYQKAGIAFSRGKPSTFFADEMGLGKTIEAIGMINDSENLHRILVMCPTNLSINWRRELEKWLTVKRSIAIADGECFPTTQIVICPYTIAHKWEKSLSYFWDLIILDEAHQLKNPETMRTRAVVGYRPSRAEKKTGMLPYSGIPARKKVALSGTPIENRPMDLQAVLGYLDPERFGNRFQFGLRYAGGKQSMMRGKVIWTFKGATNMRELQESLRSNLMIRRLKKDVLRELPPKRRQIIEFPNSLKLAKDERDQIAMFEEGLAELQAKVLLSKASDRKEDYNIAAMQLKDYSRTAFKEMSLVRKKIGMAKIPFAVEHLKETIDERGDNKVLVFAHHLDVIHALHKEFPHSVILTGEMDPHLKQASVDRFQRDQICGPFFGNIRAAGVGYTLTAADLVFFVELDWVPSMMTQAEDRAHRFGQKNSVLVQHSAMAGTMDARMVHANVHKQNIIDQCLDDTRSTIEAEEVTGPARYTITFKQLEKRAATLTTAQCGAASQALRRLPLEMFGQDRILAVELIKQGGLNQKQGVLALDLCNRYGITI